MKTRMIKQKVAFLASAHDVYEALMDSKKHASFTGGAAKISRKVGGSFSVFDGYAVGKNIELIEDQKIVQAWRASDWEEGVISEVSFILHHTKSGCNLEFTHKGVPSEQFTSIKQGWVDFYWIPMKELLKKD
ncbi:MAG: SRPBCC domain-containing protein [Bacteroidota bacterium]